MRLYLSNRSPLNAAYSNEEGQVLYTNETPFKFAGRRSTIQRVLPNESVSDEKASVDCRDRFEPLATIEWKHIKYSQIYLGQTHIDTKTYFKHVGIGWLGSHRVFTAPDGREYKWILGAWTSKLVLNDGNNTLVAEFHPKKWSLLTKSRDRRDANLEITKEGEHMIDLILVTFIYIEKVRKDRERHARSGQAGGGS